MSTVIRLEPNCLGNDNYENLKGHFKFDVPIVCPREIYWNNEPHLTANF